MDLIIAGRGESMNRFDFPEHIPVMAVASAVFLLSECKTLRHFCSLDTPRSFQQMSPAHRAVDVSWGNDSRVLVWPFWNVSWLRKHISKSSCRHGYFRPGVPEHVLQQIPERDQEVIRKAFHEDPGLEGWQNGWLDYPSVQPWKVTPTDPPDFTGTKESIGLWSQAAVDDGFDAVRHSLLFAMQLAPRLGYRRCFFVGCDLNHERWDVQRRTIREWAPQAAAEGVEWFNLSPESALVDAMETIDVSDLSSIDASG